MINELIENFYASGLTRSQQRNDLDREPGLRLEAFEDSHHGLAFFLRAGQWSILSGISYNNHTQRSSGEQRRLGQRRKRRPQLACQSAGCAEEIIWIKTRC